MPDSPGPVEVRTWKLTGHPDNSRMEYMWRTYTSVEGPLLKRGESVLVVDRDAFVEDVLALIRAEAASFYNEVADFLEARLGRAR